MGEIVELSEELVDSYSEEIMDVLAGVYELEQPELAIALARIAGEMAASAHIDRLIQEVDRGEE